MELTDLEIRKKITEIELNEGIAKNKPIEFDERQNRYWIESAGFSSYPLIDPLTDDALCFQLMAKYKVWCTPLGDTGKWSARMWYGDNYLANAKSEFINKAICLAIIEAHKND